MNRETHILSVVTAALLGVAGAATRAAEVSMQVAADVAYVNEQISVQIQVTGAEQVGDPVFPNMDGAVVRGPRAPSRSEFVSIVNGRMTKRVTLTYVYTVTPNRPGMLKIGPITVNVDGEVLSTGARTVRVEESDAGDLLFLSMTSQRPYIYLGEAIDVELEIWVKRYKDRNVPNGLDAKDTHSLLNLQQSEWGQFAEALRRIDKGELQWQYHEATRPDTGGVDQGYYVFVLPTRFVPAKVGPLEPGPVSVVLSYPTRTSLERDFFRRQHLQVKRTRPIRASLGPTDIQVLSPPEEGKPPGFNGAVGRFRWTAEAVNTDVRVREPIELTLTVSGEGVLERVPPPPLESVEALTRHFKVPVERLRGVVSGDRKRFVVTVRAKDAEVSEIPPIPFVYFDPIAERYVTDHSDPIPVRVTASEQVSVAQFDAGRDGAARSAARLTETGAGIRANYADMDEVLAQQAFEPGWISGVLLVGSPLAYVATMLVQRRRYRLRHDRGYARRRRAGARALAAVRAATDAEGDAPVAAGIAAAVIAYISDRCNAPAGLTGDEAAQQLVQRNVPASLLGRVEALLAQCEAQEYAGGGSLSAADLSDEARRCVRDLERERF